MLAQNFPVAQHQRGHHGDHWRFAARFIPPRPQHANLVIGDDQLGQIQTGFQAQAYARRAG